MLEVETAALVARFVDLVNTREFEAVAALMSPGFVAHWAGRPDVQGAEAWIQAVEAMLAGVPDLRYTAHHVVADEAMAAMHYSWAGTHQGPVRGIAPTGARLSVEGMVFFRIADGALAEEWAVDDMLGLLQQLKAGTA